MTPAGRSRQYVGEICRRIGEDKIELGNACRGVSLRKARSGQGEAVGSTAEQAVDGEPVAGEGGNGIKEGENGKEERGRWQVMDSQGKTRCFDEVRKAFICEVS